jgi:hypothetical protein
MPSNGLPASGVEEELLLLLPASRLPELELLEPALLELPLTPAS